MGLDLDPGRPSALHSADFASLINAAARIVEATWEQVAAYKLNMAFFERHGPAGNAWLADLTALIGDRAIIIGDGKRGDIGNSARHYAEALFGQLRMDAATVHPSMGYDSLAPFAEDSAKGVFILCLTSNPGSADFQRFPDDDPLYLRIANWAQRHNTQGNLGLVVGATQPDDFSLIRSAAPDLPLLVPGVGAQGGDLEAALEVSRPHAPVLITISRGLTYAGTGTIEEIVAATQSYNARIQEALS